ncbi:Pyruvate,phosphate dikinase [[Actinomadura] parvosata subsp. kistnae]|nr:Pyruvate,phosphate dikinase [Actinomadura parvosata subsp. kistnae]
MAKYVYDFTEGNRNLKDLLGGKGANLAEMTNLGLPVPHGFTITTEACRHYLAEGSVPSGLDQEVAEHLEALEAKMGRKLGQADDPLLVSVRSGAKFSMPGMMETVLNIGLNDESVHGLAKQSGGNDRFAWDSYRRLIQMFGKTVLGIDGDLFERALDDLKGRRHDTDLDSGELQQLVETYKGIVRDQTGKDFPADPREQMRLAVMAVFDSWNAPRAILYRRQERIPADLGTAVNIMAMVFGNYGNDSGTGVAFTRDPGSGQQGIYGDYLQNAQGEDVVAGIRNTIPLQDLEHLDKPSYDQLVDIMETLENHYRDLCDIEFTIERGKLWMLQTRVGKRTAAAAFCIATQLVDQGLITMDEAVTRVTGDQLAQLMFPRFDGGADKKKIAKGMNASPGAAVGKAVFSSERAVELAGQGEDVILVRRETNPDDLAGMIAARGILTSRGGKTSHAAVVARGMGKTCVCGAEDLDVQTAERRFTAPAASSSPRATSSPSTAPAARSTSARSRSSTRPWSSTSKAPPSRRTTSSRRSTASCATPTPSAGSACGPTPTPPRTPPAPAASARRASGCAAPSTCSWASAASSSRTSCWPPPTRNARPPWTPWNPSRSPTSSAYSRPCRAPPSPSASSTRPCTSSCPTSSTCPSRSPPAQPPTRTASS